MLFSIGQWRRLQVGRIWKNAGDVNDQKDDCLSLIHENVRYTLLFSSCGLLLESHFGAIEEVVRTTTINHGLELHYGEREGKLQV